VKNNLMLAFLLLISLNARAFTVPAFSSNVFDETHTLSAEDISLLHQTIQDLRDHDGIWAAVAIFDSTQGETIEQASNQTFHEWALGQKGIDNGLLLFVAKSDHHMRVEVGRGLEGTITDLESHRVVDEIMKPNFREGHFSKGLNDALLKLRDLQHGEPLPEPAGPSFFEDTHSHDLRMDRVKVGAAVNFLPLIVFWLMYLVRLITWRYPFTKLPKASYGLIPTSCFFALFFSVFWGFVQLEFIFPFNSLFIAGIFLGASDGFKTLYSRVGFDDWMREWSNYETRVATYSSGLAHAKVLGVEKLYLTDTDIPLNPRQADGSKRFRPSPARLAAQQESERRAFAELREKGTGSIVQNADGYWIYSTAESIRSTSSSSSSSGSSSSDWSSSSSSSSSDSSSGGGDSNGGGASGSW
jgi:uncharacterized protein